MSPMNPKHMYDIVRGIDVLFENTERDTAPEDDELLDGIASFRGAPPGL